MNNKHAKFERFWSWVGKIGTIIVIVSGVASVLILVPRSGVRISATATEAHFQISPDLVNAHSKARALESYSSLVDYLRNKLKNSIATETGRLNLLDIADELSDSFSIAWGDDFRSNLDKYEYYYSITIINRGNMVAKNAKLIMPIDGYYQVNTSGSNIEMGKFSRSITLLDLQPRIKKVVEVWSQSSFSIPLFYEKSTFVTYENGSTVVDFALEVYGLPKTLAENLSFLPLVVLLIGFIIFWSIYWQRVIRRNAGTKPPKKGTR